MFFKKKTGSPPSRGRRKIDLLSSFARDRRLTDAAPQVFAVPALADHLVIVHHGDAARDRAYWPAFEVPAFVQVVLGVRGEIGGVQHALLVEIDQREIGVRARV